VLILQPLATSRNVLPATENHGVPGSSPGPATSFYRRLQVKHGS